MKSILVFMTIILTSAPALAKKCNYSAASSDFKVEWTAFKTPLKAPVGGSFRSLGVAAAHAGNGIKDFLEGIEFNIDTLTTDTNNKDRDAKIVKNFFVPMLGGSNITGKTLEYSKKILKVEMTINKQMKVIPLKVTNVDGVIEAIGVIDVLDFALNKSLAGINKACFELHEGKTWSDVRVKLSIKYSKKCK